MADLLEGLREKFRERCAGDAQAIRIHLAGGPTEDSLERIIHRIAGAAGMFGAPELGAAAQALDEAYADGRPPDEDALRGLLALIDAL